MTEHEIIPRNYQGWRECITVRCQLALTGGYIAQRLRALGDPCDRHTSEFTRLYGGAHRQRVVGWFERARAELAST